MRQWYFAGLMTLLTALGLPVGTAAATPRASQVGVAVNAPRITFGQLAGNIAPFRVVVDGGGAVTGYGIIRFTGAAPTLSTAAVAGLETLAQSLGLQRLPVFTACPHTLPDIASRFIRVRSGRRALRVAVRGGCLSAFNQEFAVLMAATHAVF